MKLRLAVGACAELDKSHNQLHLIVKIESFIIIIRQ